MTKLIHRTCSSTYLRLCMDYILLMIDWEYSQVEIQRPIYDHMQSDLVALLGMDRSCLSLRTGATTCEIGDPGSDSFL